MIKNFKQKYLEEFWNNGSHKRISTHLTNRLIRKLDMMNSSKELRDLNSPPSNRLHALHGDREGEWAISVSGQWRICFRYEDGDILDVELVQYH